VSDLVGRLHGLIDELSSVDHASLSAGERRQVVLALQAEQARLGVVTADALAPWEECGVWREGGTLRAELALGRDAHRDRFRVRHELLRARRLARMPHTRAAVLAGRLSLDHVDLFVQYATAARFELFLEHEQELVEQCAAQELFDDARRVIQYWAYRADDELGLRRDRPADSTLYLSRSSDTGEIDLNGHLTAVDGEIVDNELRRLVRDLYLEDRRNGVTRTPTQRRAAALVRMAARSINATGPTARPLFQVIAGDETARRLCQLVSGHVVTPEDLAPHIDTAVMQAFLFDGPTTIIGVSKQRTFRGALRRAIQVRDRRCQHRSVCPNPAVDGDVDHRHPAARGGPTSQWNGKMECRPHNRNAELHDHDDQPLLEREITALDEFRCRIRWALLRDHDDTTRTRPMNETDPDRTWLAGRYVISTPASTLWPSRATTP
jgi:hypothetical protein